ncbi:16S rRNA (uracil(1498)-N(3))-methyltransferase [Phosphitispora sp. TUW77]|uniref:16S rRNA (uracil(1498)-N(3))-methyltransferase n=1 Tax=Phosphitispora sp. TUW77 TaxID=3152361 RepID=UPI003AB456CC
MARFFVSEDLAGQQTTVIKGPDLKHISKVLRLGPGDKIGIADAAGREFDVKIREITGKEVICDIIGERASAAELPLEVVLYQGLPKGDKLDLVIQKSTEIGVSRVVPIICERTIVKLDEKKASGRHVRWQRVALEAAKQSRRRLVPVVSEPLTFAAALAEMNSGVLGILPWEEERVVGIKDVFKGSTITNKKIAVFIGPEGGFTQEEAKQAESAGVLTVSLGPRIMRTETAGIVAAAIVLYEIGDLGGVKNG